MQGIKEFYWAAHLPSNFKFSILISKYSIGFRGSKLLVTLHVQKTPVICKYMASMSPSENFSVFKQVEKPPVF